MIWLYQRVYLWIFNSVPLIRVLNHPFKHQLSCLHGHSLFSFHQNDASTSRDRKKGESKREKDFHFWSSTQHTRSPEILFKAIVKVNINIPIVVLRNKSPIIGRPRFKSWMISSCVFLDQLPNLPVPVSSTVWNSTNANTHLAESGEEE